MTWPGKFWVTLGHFRTNFTKRNGPRQQRKRIPYLARRLSLRTPPVPVKISVHIAVWSHPHTVELHISAAFEEHAQVSTSDMSTAWERLNLQTHNLCLSCAGGKENLVQQACTSCDTIPCITCRGSHCQLGVARTLFDEFTLYVTMPFGRLRSAGLRFERYRFYFQNLSDSSSSSTPNFVFCSLFLSLFLNKVRLLLCGVFFFFTLAFIHTHSAYRLHFFQI